MDLSEITRHKSSSTVLDALRAGADRFGRSISSGLGNAQNFLGRNMEAGLGTRVRAMDPKMMSMLGAGLGGAVGGLGGAAFSGKGKRLRSALIGMLLGAGGGALAGNVAGTTAMRGAEMSRPRNLNNYNKQPGMKWTARAPGLDEAYFLRSDELSKQRDLLKGMGVPLHQLPGLVGAGFRRVGGSQPGSASADIIRRLRAIDPYYEQAQRENHQKVLEALWQRKPYELRQGNL